MILELNKTYSIYTRTIHLGSIIVKEQLSLVMLVLRNDKLMLPVASNVSIPPKTYNTSINWTAEPGSTQLRILLIMN